MGEITETSGSGAPYSIQKFKTYTDPDQAVIEVETASPSATTECPSSEPDTPVTTPSEKHRALWLIPGQDLIRYLG